MQQPSPLPIRDQDADITTFSDEDDTLLFESFDDPEEADNILRIKRNDPNVNSLYVGRRVSLDDAASRRLGEILGQSTYLEELQLWGCHIDVETMSAGLQSNRSIEKFEIEDIDLQNSEKMIGLAPFLVHNPCLKIISLESCNLRPASVNILANALSTGAESNLEELNLYNNPIGNVDMDCLVRALRESRRLRKLNFSRCEIGPRACASLATLLEDPESNLTDLYLMGNFIKNESSITFAESLSNNKKLRILELGGNGRIASEGWSAMLQLVCDGSSVDNLVNSNHALHRLYASGSILFIQALGVDGGNLLRASLKLNEGNNKLLITRRKIIWGHTRGDLNIGEASIAAGFMPRILAWIGNDSDQSDSEIIEYPDPPLQEHEIGIIRLGGIYRILRSMPDLCNREGGVPDRN